MFKPYKINEEIRTEALEMGYGDNLSTILGQYYKGENLNDFLDPTFKLGDYHQLLDLDRGSDILMNSMLNNEHIIIIVDYDVDGTSSGAIMTVFLRDYLGYSNYTVVTNERRYGNGINDEMVGRVFKSMRDKNTKLLVTADHGSNDTERYVKLKNDGLKIIVTDHHLVPVDEPQVDAFINPQRNGGNFNTYISGCTTLFFLLLDTYDKIPREYKKRDDQLKKLLPYVAITIIADQMNLLDPLNRRVYLEGIKHIQDDDSIWKRIMSRLTLPEKFTTMSISFGLSGLINSGGRMDNAGLSTRVMSASSDRELHQLLKELLKLNDNRKSLQNNLLGVGDKQLKSFSEKFKNVLVTLLKDGHGVGGIVAGTLGEKYQKPIFAFSEAGDSLVGSGRSIVGDVSIYDVIQYMKDKEPGLIIKGGGHKGAGGCSIDNDRDAFMKFIALFDEYVGGLSLDTSGDRYYNLKINIQDITMDLFNDLYKLDPYGMNFSSPVLYLEKVKITKLQPIGKNKDHYKLIVSDNNITKELIFFHCKSMFRNIYVGDIVNITLSVGVKSFLGKEQLSIIGERIEVV